MTPYSYLDGELLHALKFGRLSDGVDVIHSSCLGIPDKSSLLPS